MTTWEKVGTIVAPFFLKASNDILSSVFEKYETS
jgi:hypothetical protein